MDAGPAVRKWKGLYGGIGIMEKRIETTILYGLHGGKASINLNTRRCNMNMPLSYSDPVQDGRSLRGSN